jgi:hypothetical protein
MADPLHPLRSPEEFTRDLMQEFPNATFEELQKEVEAMGGVLIKPKSETSTRPAPNSEKPSKP